MIEVTDEMLEAVAHFRLANHVNNKYDHELINNIIEMHEASKSKPEPDWYIQLDVMEDQLWRPSMLSESAKESGRWVPLYAEPPTREPLSDDEVWRIYDEGDNVSSSLEFARAIEKAHGIGV